MELEDDTPLDGGTVYEPASGTSDVDALAAILDDPLDEDTGEVEDHNAADDADDLEDVINDDDEGDEADAEDSDDDTEDEDNDGPEDTGGKFVAHTARIRMPDGTTTTAQELIKGYLRQSDYTRKRQEDSVVRQKLEEDRARIGQVAQQLETTFGRAKAMLKQWEPTPPQDQNDPMAWIEYQQQQVSWSHWQSQLEEQEKEARAKLAEESKAWNENFRKEQDQKLHAAIPQLADPAKRTAFMGEAKKVMAQFGFTPEEIENNADHRVILVMRELMKLKRNAEKAPVVKQKIKEKPKMIHGGKRSPGNNGKSGKEARLSQLRKTGSSRDAVASLMDLDL